jgi:hypothetical protein
MRRLFRFARFAGAAALAAMGVCSLRDAHRSLRRALAKAEDVLDRSDAIVRDVGEVVKTVADGLSGAHVKDLIGKLEQHTGRIAAAFERASTAKPEAVKKRVFGLIK